MQCLDFLYSTLGCMFTFLEVIYFSEYVLLLLIPVGSQRVNVILVTLGRKYDRRKFCMLFWRQSRHATSLLWGCGHSVPAAGNTWLPAPQLPQHCHLPYPGGQQLSQQLKIQSAAQERLSWLLSWCLGPSLISELVDGWKLCMCVCVWGGGGVGAGPWQAYSCWKREKLHKGDGNS